VTKVLIILALTGAVANALAASHSDPPMLIDSSSSSAPLDAQR
jgi:hypothetical protein